MLFQAMFAVITPALISGALVERIRVKAFVLFVVLWSLVVYTPVAHWVWAPGGWLRARGVLDFAGGTVVHINAAAAAIVGALLLGKRRGLQGPHHPPAQRPLRHPRAPGMLWFGWLGFNGGSALAANGLAAYAFANTFFAPAAAAAAWGLVELFFSTARCPASGLASGAVAGMVAITPAAGFVTPASALLIGALAGLASFWRSASAPASASTTRSTSSRSTAWPPRWARCSPASSPPRPSTRTAPTAACRCSAWQAVGVRRDLRLVGRPLLRALQAGRASSSRCAPTSRTSGPAWTPSESGERGYIHTDIESSSGGTVDA